MVRWGLLAGRGVRVSIALSFSYWSTGSGGVGFGEVTRGLTFEACDLADLYQTSCRGHWQADSNRANALRKSCLHNRCEWSPTRSRGAVEFKMYFAHLMKFFTIFSHLLCYPT